VRARGGRIRLGEPVARIDADGRGFLLATNSSQQSHRAVILAAHPSRAAQLIGHLHPMAQIIERIKPLTHEPIVTVYLQYARAPRMSFPMMGFVDACTQWLFDRGAISSHDGLLAAVISARGRHQRCAHDELAQRVHAEIACAFPSIGQPRWMQVIEEKRATFACVPNLERPDQQTPVPGLYLAGDYTRSDHPATLESAVRSGLHCADLACEFLARR
jgi:predicted NAD/FAD-binding protein